MGYCVWFEFPHFEREKTQVEEVLNDKRFHIGDHREKTEKIGLLSLWRRRPEGT